MRCARAVAQQGESADVNCTMGPQMASKTTPALVQARQWGRIEVFPAAVAAIAGHAAMRCYGISGMAGRGLRDGVAELLRRENVDRGVDVVGVDEGLAIDVFVIVQYGVRISEVAHNLQQTVKFEVERSVNVPVVQVNVNVQGVREERS
ncbi:MAG TPA: Asp23/Gls24 family envelope stress response protein [Candidatus Dormibacteraeota bacterium]